MRVTRGRVQVELDALGDPGADQFIIRFARLNQHAADVRHAAGRLEQHQAAFRSGPVEAPAADVVGQGAVIEERIVAAQRQLKAVLALGAAVAGARRCSPAATAPA